MPPLFELIVRFPVEESRPHRDGHRVDLTVGRGPEGCQRGGADE
ncbi:hypothetical protein [Natrarchaeobius halalkaliphilus]|nr:hypothetical protein [Natrarchaeobius halalkaliphilus]